MPSSHLTVVRNTLNSYHTPSSPIFFFFKGQEKRRELTAWWSLNSRGASGQHWNPPSFLLMQFLFLDVNASCAFLKVIKGNEDTF